MMRGAKYVKRKKENGISMDNQIRIASEGANNNRFIHLLFQICFIIAAVLAILYSWFEGLELKVDHRLFLTGLLLTIFMYIAFQEFHKIRWYLLMIYLALLGSACYHYWAFLENGFYVLENAILEKASLYYGLNPVRFIVYEDESRSITILFLLIAQVITFVVSVEVYHHYMRSIYLFCILLFYGVLLALGVVPPAFWLLLVVGIYLAMRTMDHIPNGVHKKIWYHRRSKQAVSVNGKQRIRIQSAIVMLVLFTTAYLIARLVIPKADYGDKINFDEQKKEIQKSIREFSVAEFVEDVKKQWNQVNPFNSDNGKTSGGLNSGKIGEVGTVRFTGEKALNVIVDNQVAYLYLKGFAGADYKGDEWANVSTQESKEYDQILKGYGNGKYNGETLLWKWMELVGQLEPLKDLGIKKTEISVEYKNANKRFLYAPYINSYKLFPKLNTVSDQYVLPPEQSRDDYFFTDTYVSFLNSDLNQLLQEVYDIDQRFELTIDQGYPEFLAFEYAYRSYVHEVYTKLPEEGLEQLRQVSFETGYGGMEDTIWLIHQVIEFIHGQTDYSLSPGIPAKGQDFAEYFLFDAKKGYCSHYATAAVLLLRNYDVPARYVEGYVVTTDDIKKGMKVDGKSIVSVRDYNAHAWIEVYFDGVGWIPIEVTEGYSEEGVSDLLDEIREEKDEKVTQAPTVTPTTKPTPTTVAKQVSPTIAPTKTIEKQPTTMSESRLSTPQLILLLIIIVIISIVCGFVLHYLIKRHMILSGIAAKDTKNQAIFCYLQIEKLLKECGINRQENDTYECFATKVQSECSLLPNGFNAIVELALKAQFSNEVIRKEEANQVLHFYLKFRTNYEQSLGSIKRFWIKYWKVI